MDVDDFVKAANEAIEPEKIRELIEIGKKLVDEKEGFEKGRVLGTLGNLYYAIRSLDEAEEAYREALQLFINLSKEDEKYMKYVVGALFNLGNLYQVKKNYEEAEKAYSDAIEVLEYTKDEEQLAAVLTALGTMYAKLGFDKWAEERLIRAFELARKLRNARQLGIILNNLAVVYDRMNRKKEAEILLKKALDVLEEIDSKEDVAFVLQNLMPYLKDAELESMLSKLEGKELPPALMAKVRYYRAKKLEEAGSIDEAMRALFEAACYAFLAYRNFGQESVNFIYCLNKVEEKSEELAEDAKTLREIIMKYYFGANVEVELRGKLGDMIRDRISGVELICDQPLKDVVETIVRDLIERRVSSF